MVKIAIYKKGDVSLVIYRTPKGNLVGEVYADGVCKRGNWSQRATFYESDGDATEQRVCEYFGFSLSDEWWHRWA